MTKSFIDTISAIKMIMTLILDTILTNVSISRITISMKANTNEI